MHFVYKLVQNECRKNLINNIFDHRNFFLCLIKSEDKDTNEYDQIAIMFV